jgi:hypothetical protein
MPRRESAGADGRKAAVIEAYRLEMSDEDDRQIGNLLRRPTVINLMLLLILGFVLIVAALVALSHAD